jgi:LacI family transcriptional regulator
MKPRPTIIDVAQKARVSIATVSRVLNGVYVREESRLRVQKAVLRLGYRHNKIAKGLVTGKSGVIGVIVPGIVGHLYGQVARGIEEVLLAQSLHMVIVTNTRNAQEEKENLKLLLERQVDAVIILGSYLHDSDLKQLGLNVPVVFIQRENPLPASRYSSVTINNRSGMEAAIRHLVTAGHRHIAHVSGLRRDGLERRDLFAELVRAASLCDSYIFEGNFTEQGGLELCESILAHQTITAILCANDRMALGLFRGLHSKGVRIPEDISVIGFDDEPWTAFLEPPLTTLRQPARETGRLAAEQVLQELNGASKSNHQIIPIDFIERASVSKRLMSKTAVSKTGSSKRSAA